MKHIIPTQSPNLIERLGLKLILLFSFSRLLSLADEMHLVTLLTLLPSLTLAGLVLPREANENQVQKQPTTTYAGTCTCKKHRGRTLEPSLFLPFL